MQRGFGAREIKCEPTRAVLRSDDTEANSERSDDTDAFLKVEKRSRTGETSPGPGATHRTTSLDPNSRGAGRSDPSSRIPGRGGISSLGRDQFHLAVDASSGQSRREPGGTGLQPTPDLRQLPPHSGQQLLGLTGRVDAILSAKRHQVEALDDLGPGPTSRPG